MSISIHSYLRQYADCSSLTLVGPMDFAVEPVEEPVIFIDGGTRHRQSTTGIAIGDGDSASVSYPLDIKLNPDKAYSDLAYALDHIDETFDQLNLLGFLGGRRDHELFNFGEVNRWLQNRQTPARVDFEDQVIMLSKGSWRLTVNGVFSLATLQSNKIKLTGNCRYQLPERTKIEPMVSTGLSNYATGEITIDCDQPLILFHNIGSQFTVNG